MISANLHKGEELTQGMKESIQIRRKYKFFLIWYFLILYSIWCLMHLFCDAPILWLKIFEFFGFGFCVDENAFGELHPLRYVDIALCDMLSLVM